MLPAINTCGRNWVPACELADTLTHSTSPLEWVGDFAIFGAPYLLGAMVALAALGRTTPERALGKVMGVGAWILIMGCMGLLVGAWISEKAWATGWPPPLQLPFVFIQPSDAAARKYLHCSIMFGLLVELRKKLVQQRIHIRDRHDGIEAGLLGHVFLLFAYFQARPRGPQGHQARLSAALQAST